jgi:hypothetical protein
VAISTAENRRQNWESIISQFSSYRCWKFPQ